MRVLFLDIDGVLLSGKELWRTHNNRHLPLDAIDLLNEVCLRTDCKVVVSSTWRMDARCRDLLRKAGFIGEFHDDWHTPLWVGAANGLLLGMRRGYEIDYWLTRKPDVTSYAIIDDDSDMLPSQRSRFVQTKFEDGIQREHVERLVAILTDDKR